MQEPHSDNHTYTESHHGTYRSCCVGFVMSIILTLLAYQLVTGQLVAGTILSGWTLTIIISFLGVVQVLVQLVCFLNLGRETKPRWNLVAFSFMVVVIGILVGGSLWIMYNLTERTMDMASSSMSPSKVLYPLDKK